MKYIIYLLIILNFIGCSQESNNDKTIYGLKETAKNLYNKGNYKGTINILQEVLAIDSKDSIAYYYIGQCYLKQQRFRKSIDSYNSAISIGNSYQYAYISRGLAKYKIGELEEAEIDYLKALELKPNDHRVMNNLGNLYSLKKDYSNAISNYEKAHNLRENNHHYIYNLANTYYKNKRYIDAKSMLKLNLTDSSKDVRSSLLMSKTLLQLDNSNKACEYLSDIIEIGNSQGIDYYKVENIEIEIDLNNLSSFQEVIDVLNIGVRSNEIIYFEATNLQKQYCLN